MSKPVEVITLKQKLRDPRLWLSVTSCLCVLYLAVQDLDRTSPGKLSGAHQRVSELASRNGCSNCHGTKDTTLADSCLECHERIAEQIVDGGGLHGRLEETTLRACSLCHQEHHGEEFPMVNSRSFAIAGIPDRDEFDHELIGFTMEGKHLELECTKCHEHADDDILPEGELRFGGLVLNCVECHEDPHEGLMTRACMDCHTQVAFDQLSKFAHTESFPLVGSHGRVGCLECHPKDSEHAVELLGGDGPKPPARECQDCHESPHANTFIEGIAQVVALSTGQSCQACHDFAHESFRDPEIELTPEQHACTGFSLEAPHDKAECTDCHSYEEEEFALRYPERDPNRCVECHEDRHQGQFDDTPFAMEGCIACHDRLHFGPHAFDAELHGLTAFPLTGHHVEVDCFDCHNRPEDEDALLVFEEAPNTCESCHDDAHQGKFADLAATLAPQVEGECARCHLTSSFSDVPPEEFDHGFWTGFELVGAHAQAECAICHPASADPDEFGRTFGWAVERFGEIESCSSCHQNPHGDDFDHPILPQEVNGRTGCARCHMQTSFRTLPEDGFDHFLWTGFPLLGAHAEAACSECHTPRPTADGRGRTFDRAIGHDCADCHREPHVGQFAMDGLTDCVSCHLSTASFSDLTFDHNRDSRFALDESHAMLECSACHQAWELRDGTTAVRYKPLGMECVDCHGVNEGQMRARKKKN